MAGRESNPTVAVTAFVALAVVIVAAIAAVTLLLLDGDPDASTAADDASSSTMSPTASPTASGTAKTGRAPSATPTPTPTEESGPGDVADLPAGLFCRDLEVDGYSYSAAVSYWRSTGQPNQMDEDRNGIPCQTVYSPTDVSSYWGESEVPDDVASPVASLPDGLLCRDLQAQGYSYADAVAYWFVQDLPDRMDDDLDGIPCATVYPSSDVDAYWGG